jgi:hypothetical protein
MNETKLFYHRDIGFKNYPLLGSQPMENVNKESICHEIVAKINGDKLLYDHFVEDAGNRRELIARVTYLCGELK